MQRHFKDMQPEYKFPCQALRFPPNPFFCRNFNASEFLTFASPLKDIPS